MPGAITVITIASVIVVTLSQLHPSLLLTNTTTTGGDTGAHIAMPKFLESLVSHGHLTGWDPGWYDGFPLYTFYFTIPDLFIAIGGWIIPYGVAFKLGTILGSVLLPICAWACGRFFRLRAPLPTLLAAATLPFLFDYTFTIYGGNLFSTLAGEYAYSFSLSLAVLFLGLFACAVREGRYRGWAAVVLAGCVLSHIVPGMYALGGAVILTVVELLPARWGIADSALRVWRRDDPAARRCRGPAPCGGRARPWRSGCCSRAGGWCPSDWSTRTRPPWATRTWRVGPSTSARPTPGRSSWPESAPSRRSSARSRFGITVTVLGIASALATALDPQGSLYNVRLLPLWFISVYFMAAWAFGTGCIAVATAWRRARTGGGAERARGRADRRRSRPGRARLPTVSESEADPGRAPAAVRPARRWGPAAVSGAVLGLLAVMVAVVPPFIFPASSLPVTVGANEVTNWSSYNYEGYEGQASYPEFHSLMQTMAAMGKRYGCGRAMWEYSTRARTASARPRRSCSCPMRRTDASTPWRDSSSSPRPRRRTTSSIRPSCPPGRPSRRSGCRTARST